MQTATSLLSVSSSTTDDESLPRLSTSGLTAMAFVVNTPACRSAMMNARAMLAGRCMQLTLVHCITGDHSLTAMQAFLQSLAQDIALNSGIDVHTDLIIKKYAHQAIAEVLADHVEASQPGLVIVSSSVSSSQAAPASTRRTSCTGYPSASPSKSSSPLQRQMCNQPLSLKISQEIPNVPVLLVKSDPRSTLLPRLMTSRPIHCMMELQATSRDMMDWTLNFLDPQRDKLLLAVSNAFEREGMMKATAARTLTAFSVQASTSSFKVAQRALKGDPVTCLPQALVADKVNLLMLHAPRSRYLAPWVVELVQSAPSSVLIFPSMDNASATSFSPPRTAGFSSPGYSFRPSTPLPLMRPRSISCEIGISHTEGIEQSMAAAAESAAPSLSVPTERAATPSSIPTERSSRSPERRGSSGKLPSIPKPPTRVPSQGELILRLIASQVQGKPRACSAR